MKKIIKVLSVFALAGAMVGAGAIAGCGHKHTFSEVWTADGANGHYHAATCEHTEEKSGLTDHVWDGDNDATCDTCGYVRLVAPGPNDTVNNDNAIVTAYEGEATGPVAGTQNVTAGFSAENSPAAGWTDGCVTITSGTIRNRDAVQEDEQTKIPGYTKSVQNGVIEIKMPVGGKITIEFSSGSSSKGSAKYKLTKPDGTVDEVVVDYAAKVLRTLVIENAEAGTYVFEKGAGTIDTYNVKAEYSITATAIKSIEVTDGGTTDYLVSQKVDCTGVEIIAKDEAGVSHSVNLKNCKFNTAKYNPNASGEYEIGVTYYLDSNLDSETKQFSTTYKVKVYMVDSIQLTTIGLAKNQVTAQQAYLPGGTFSKENISVIATCKFGNSTVEQKLKADWYSVSTPTLTAEGKQTVTVSVNTAYTTDNKAVTASYDVVVKAKKEAVKNVVEVTVGETGEFATLTQAVQYLKACAYDNGINKVIKLQKGTYTEKVWIDMPNVTLIGLGEKADDTKITYSLVEGDVDPLSNAVWGLNCATVHVTGDNFKAYNLSIRNDFDYIKNSGNYSGSQAAQGVALTLEGDNNVIYNCHLFGNQDTLYMKSGRTYYYKTQIDGNVDFIFGGEKGIAYFEECDIVAISRGKSENGHVAVPQHKDATKPEYGYIFSKCTFKDDGNVAAGGMTLGRPWGDKSTVAYINCSFTAAYGMKFADMSGNKPENADFCVYGSTDDKGTAITDVPVGGQVLTAEQAANYTKANIFGTANGKSGYTTVFDCDAEFTKLKILAGLEEGEIPQDTKVTITVKDDTSLPNGDCATTINSKYGEYLEWTGLCKFESAKPENGIKVDATTVITFKVVGEVSLVAGYQLPVEDYTITYNGGKATVKFTAATGTYGDYIGGFVIDTSKTPGDTGNAGPSTPSTPGQTTGEAVTYKVTVANGAGVVDKAGVTVAYASKDGATTSPNKDDFKFDGGKATVTLTISGAKAGQTVSVKMYGYTGSTDNAAGVKATATNATQKSTSNTVDFPADKTKVEGTVEFTVTADGTVEITIVRSGSTTARLVSVEITVA